MKIVVCVKEVMDVTFPFDLDQETLHPLKEDVFYRINPADKCAVEMALSLQEAHGGEVIYLTFGPERTEKMLKSCLAMGGGQAIRVWEERPEIGNQTKAYLLAKAVAQQSPDVILCGAMSLDEGTGETPVALAEFLDVPQVTGITDLSVSDGGKSVVVKRKLERGRREEIECPLPAVLSLELGIRQPRYAALPDVLKAYRAAVACLEADDVDADFAMLRELDSLLRTENRSLPRPRPKKTFKMDSNLSAEERMEMMMSGGLKKESSDMLEGTPEDVAKKLAGVIREKVFNM